MQKTNETIFSGSNLSALEQAASERGISLDALVSELVSAEVARRYLIPKLSAGAVLAFPRKATAPSAVNFRVTDL